MRSRRSSSVIQSSRSRSARARWARSSRSIRSAGVGGTGSAGSVPISCIEDLLLNGCGEGFVVTLNAPGVTAAEQGGKIALALPRDRRADLIAEQGLVGGPVDVPEDADRGVLERRGVQPRQREGLCRVRMARVVHDDAGGIRRGQVDDLEAGRGPAQPLVLLRAEHDGLLVLEADGDVVADLRVLHRLEGAVVEDVAVLV